MYELNNSEATRQGGPATVQMNGSSAILSDVAVAQKPDLLGKWRRRVMREIKRDPAYKSLHPNVKRTVAHVVMRHMNPERGFFMRQGEFAKELGVSQKTVGRHLRKAVERELFVSHGSMYTETWKGVNTYRVHPRVLGPVPEGVLGGVPTKKFHKEAPLGSFRCEATQENYAAASALTRPAAEDQDQGQELGLEGMLPEAGAVDVPESSVQADPSKGSALCADCGDQTCTCIPF